jgi:biotin operon repressor
MLPLDPVILLSYINTRLRDNYSSLEALCDDLELGDTQKEDLIAKLKTIGYEYDEILNRFNQKQI